jgi:hypothetical protein
MLPVFVYVSTQWALYKLTVEDIRPEYLTRHIQASKNFCFSQHHTT